MIVVKSLILLASAAVIFTAVAVSMAQLVASEREARKDRTCPTRDPRR